jgi:hypothetical protein
MRQSPSAKPVSRDSKRPTRSAGAPQRDNHPQVLGFVQQCFSECAGARPGGWLRSIEHAFGTTSERQLQLDHPRVVAEVGAAGLVAIDRLGQQLNFGGKGLRPGWRVRRAGGHAHDRLGPTVLLRFLLPSEGGGQTSAQ